MNKNSSQTGTQGSGSAATNSSVGSSSSKSNSNSQGSSSSSNSMGTGRTISESAQGKSNQQATSGKDGVKNIQSKLQQYSGPITKKINGLSTTQKVVGGSLLALGAGWLALSSDNKNKIMNTAGFWKSAAQEKLGGKKGGSSMASSSGASSDSSNTMGKKTNTGSSAVDAKV